MKKNIFFHERKYFFHEKKSMRGTFLLSIGRVEDRR